MRSRETVAPRRDVTLERLMDGAQRTFAERGYRAANIQEICTRSNVGIGTFYAHFEHKRELLQQVCVERQILLTTSMTPEILHGHARLVALLGTVIDDPIQAGMLRAWYEAVLEEPAIARFHGAWRAATLVTLSQTVAVAQQQFAPDVPLRDPTVVAWAIATLSREMAIHERKGAPDLETLARLIEDLVFGSVTTT